MRAAIVVTLLIGLSVAANGADESQSFVKTRSGAIAVPVFVDGHGPAVFLLDTGSSRTAISTSLAARIGARPVGTTRVLTPSGSVTRPLVPLPRIVAGPSRPMAALAMILPDADLLREVSADGILGQDVLTHLTITIDYDAGRVHWRPVDVPDDAIALRMENVEGRLAFHLPCGSGNNSARCRPLTLIPDTGSDSVVLFRRPTSPLPLVTPLGIATLKTVAGTRVVSRGLIDAADLSAIGLDGQIASIVDFGDIPRDDVPPVDGLLPLHLFARVTLDGPGKRLILVPR